MLTIEIETNGELLTAVGIVGRLHIVRRFIDGHLVAERSECWNLHHGQPISDEEFRDRKSQVDHREFLASRRRP